MAGTTPIKPDTSTVELIIKLNATADEHQRTASVNRHQAAGYIVGELRRGVSTRALGRAVEKSQSFVARSARAWEVIEASENLGPADFQSQFRIAKSRSSSKSTDETEWTKSLSLLKARFTALLDAADAGQTGPLLEVCQGFVRRARKRGKDSLSGRAQLEAQAR